MNNNNGVLTGLVGFILGIVVAMFVFPSWGMTSGPMRGMMNWRYDEGNMMGQNMMGNIDQHFIEQMIPHHDDAITMAKTGLQKAEHEEIKTLSQNIIRTQTAENEQMKTWYQAWFGGEVEEIFPGMSIASGMMHGGMMGDSTDMNRLENAEPFDKAFIEEMIPHHQMAVMMAQMLERTTDRSEMKKLAADIISAQTKEINQMRQWYQDWYK